MNINSSYIHALEGRLRLKVPEVKGAPLQAREVERHLAQCPGVDEVAANSITGSVLILYNPRLIGPEEIVLAIREIGCLQGPQPQAHGAAAASQPEGVVGQVATAMASALMEMALTRLVIAII